MTSLKHAVRQTGHLAKVIPINLHRPAKPVSSGASPISQARLAEGYELYLEHMRVTRALREFQMRIESDMAAGSQAEAGDFSFDPDLKIVRRNHGRNLAGR